MLQEGFGRLRRGTGGISRKNSLTRGASMAETRERAHQENSPNEIVRLYGRWYAPFSNGICWFSFILLVFPGLFRLFNPPAAGQEPLTPYLMLLGGLLFPLWHFSAACSPSTFLELSRLGFRRSVWGHARFYRWDELGPIKARVRYRGPSWVWAEFAEFSPCSHSRGPARRTCQLPKFAGQNSHRYIDRVSAWVSFWRL